MMYSMGQTTYTLVNQTTYTQKNANKTKRCYETKIWTGLDCEHHQIVLKTRNSDLPNWNMLEKHI